MRSAADDHFPEDWLASTVRAQNGEFAQNAREGLSHVEWEGSSICLIDLLRRYPKYFRGDGADSTHDSSTRLHIQAHPDRDFVREHLTGFAGKTECWYILGSRGDSYVYLGFQRPPSREEWAQIVMTQDIDRMLSCFDRIAVKPGDCFVVPGGIPHAIGEGIFMVEMMEPTDWVVRCEFEVGGHLLPESARYMGLDLDTCLDVFDYTAYPVGKVRERFQQVPRIISQGDGFIEEEIIREEFQEFFRLRRLKGDGRASWPGRELGVLIATKGGGCILAEGGRQPIRAGETWLLPGAVDEWQWESAGGNWEVMIAEPPKPRCHSEDG